MPDSLPPPRERDCLDCHAQLGMKLQNIAGTATASIPLLYICEKCGCLLTIPPVKSPVIAAPTE